MYTNICDSISDDLPLSIGFNYVADANMFSSMKDTDDDTYPKATTSGFSFDIGLYFEGALSRLAINADS